eukprot:TRINITY_DN3960_c0_g1_i2.p1 TRINITY_DN3960_c0_g1~~TRINITY_DN3960_c0_g1_i2.p1  ORF type:complete len:411 (-),score=67.32 TRINITY_DN3960_c0_g1_i2:147-1313(-)
MAWGAAGSTQPVLKPWLKQKWVTSQKRWQPKYRTSSQDSAATGRWKQPWSASWSAKWPGKCSPGSNWSARRRPTVPLTFAVDKEARYTGTVEVFYKWRGFGWISLDEKGVVPNDSLFVQWNNIQTEDRYPYLEKGMQVEFGIMKWREEKAAMSLMAKFVTIPGGATVALQDADDERSKTFFGSSTSRYKGKLDWYSPKSGLGWVTVLDDSLQGSPVPKEIRVDREEMNCGGKRAGNWIENVVVEFGIHQLQNGTYRAYNMTLPNGLPILKENIEQRKVIDSLTFSGQITYWNQQLGWGFIRLDERGATLPSCVQAKLCGMQTAGGKMSAKGGAPCEPEKVIYVRKPDLAKNYWPHKGDHVCFQLYMDVKGVGAINVEPTKASSAMMLG